MANEKILGDNSGANFDYNNQGVCGARSDRRAVWFEIIGKGKEVTVNVCSNNDKLTDFGIFNACNTQNCLGFPPQQKVVSDCAADESNKYTFVAEGGENYYVHVRSDVLFEGVGSNVSFFISIVLRGMNTLLPQVWLVEWKALHLLFFLSLLLELKFTIWYTEPTDAPTETPVAVETTAPSGGASSYNILIPFSVAGLGYAFSTFF